MNPLFANLPTSVFEVISRLARETGAVNLGQGFPDDPGPEDVRRKAAEAVVEGWNQYPPMMGLPELRSAVADHYRHWQGLDLDPETEAMITCFGLTEAALARAFSDRTKLVLFNNPLNPTATVFSTEDLRLLADFCVRHDAIAVCDEVWGNYPRA